ncbi:MAG: Nif3-like dinuclear metal center hexameric protein [Desulfuromonadales bacterium]|nr:Nif3-like dinuclear metal center hexameric protein [Desulfuromonadales bacterium]
MASKVRLQDLLGLLNGLYPPTLAETWDNVGLQVGDPQGGVERVLIALDPTPAAVAAAGRSGAQVLLCHHPLLFRPLSRLTPEDAVGQTVWAAIEHSVAVISLHTNLDRAANGLNRWLADTLGLVDSVPLLPAAGDYLKLVVFVPENHAEAVAAALFAGGAGQIGAYDQCAFRTTGTGSFRPQAGTTPYLGTIGQTERVTEIRLETILPKNRLTRCLEKMRRAHPYEEVAYDLIPLANQVPAAGLGRIGLLPAEIDLAAFAAQVKTTLGCSHLRLVGAPERTIGKVAVCGGSGAECLAAARFQGADLLVTGDLKYHEARRAEELGLALIDAGHFATERLMVTHLRDALQPAAVQKGWQLEFQAYTEETDPFRIL